ncbi:MAG: hypothetical protein EOO38_22215 [Cytophagaceae bacterium]|nr:MAG: hypothetical protein EOO38_22215 [Cytophagaceae bacterium]
MNTQPLHASMGVTNDQLRNYIFPNLGDRFEMAHRVECRAPFLNKVFCNFASKIIPR